MSKVIIDANRCTTVLPGGKLEQDIRDVLKNRDTVVKFEGPAIDDEDRWSAVYDAMPRTSPELDKFVRQPSAGTPNQLKLQAVSEECLCYAQMTLLMQSELLFALVGQFPGTVGQAFGFPGKVPQWARDVHERVLRDPEYTWGVD